MRRTSASHALLAVALLGISGCAAPRPSEEVSLGTLAMATRPPPTGLDPDDEPIGVGDTLFISIAHLLRIGETHTMSVRVEPARSVSLPVLGQFRLTGATTAAVRDELRRRLRADEVLRDPHVTVLVSDRRAPRLTVLGAVRSPGTRVLLRRTVTLVDALALAGGVLPDAAALIRIEGEDGARRVELAAATRTSLRAGDVVVVPFAGRYGVVGHVARPGAYLLRRRTTVLQALALAGGIDATGAVDQVWLRRATANGPTRVEVNLAAIADRAAADVVLEDGDLLEVPGDATRWLADGARSLLRRLREEGPHVTLR